MPEKTDLHIGKMVREKLKEEGRSTKWLAEKVFCEYSGFCKILKKPLLDTGLLLRISIVLHHDFFASLSKYIAENNN